MMTRRTSLSFTALAVCLVLVAGCTDDEPRSDALDPPEWLREADPAIDRPTWIRMPASQKDLLTDGALAFDEYASAVRATVACTAAKGHDVTEPAPSADGMYMTWNVASSGPPPSAFYAELSECETEHSVYIERLWSLIHPPTADHIRQAQEAIEACMADAGIEMPRMDSLEFEAWVDEGGRGLGSNRFGRCVRLAAIESGIPPVVLHDPA